eukprot:CAMPEP_0115697110 /NCGR_PEP_ID=MMETSP0272-20121206/65626_1 /TAXON_ID=71861 /ORGANISM="Scrippsiella trochoidea, Strain CCMP3099" /LENGTH=210 /DNA_ID=CAMNT_0003137357 /DNA_START=72 /DNA_END=700 /DNA_ORIENTATION=-
MPIIAAPSAQGPDVEEAAAQAEAALLSSSEQSDSAAAPPTRLRRQRLAWTGLGATVALAGLAAVGRTALHPPQPTKAAVSDDQVLAAVTCGGEGQDCHVSKCCWDGGKNGLQCWAKNEFWAVCASNETCKKGVHPGETHGTYDQYGKFTLDEWSCEKLGNRSNPACTSYEKEDECPDERCDWFRTGKCLPKCEWMTSKEACPQTHCVWDG